MYYLIKNNNTKALNTLESENLHILTLLVKEAT